VPSLLVAAAAEQFAVSEGEAILTGNGSDKPTGFLSGTPAPVTTADEGASPERAFGTLQYIATGAADGFQNGPGDSPVGSVNRADFLFDTIYALKAGYRTNARWIANRSVLGEVRKFKDIDGNYLWMPGIAAGQPASLAGYPVSEMEGMPNLGTNTFPMAFGDFRAGYLLCDLVGTRVTEDPYTTAGRVKWYIRRRLGGKMKNGDAIKVVKCAAS
jgi:HK97 family phage major capsid protein